MSVIKWWIDASYVMHEDCQVHTWSRISLGKRVMSSFSTKQTMKLKSSTEIDPIGVDDVMKKYYGQNTSYRDRGVILHMTDLFRTTRVPYFYTRMAIVTLATHNLHV